MDVKQELTEEQYEQLVKVISQCNQVEFEEPYWFDGSYECCSRYSDYEYCYSCTVKIIKLDSNLDINEHLDGGFNTEVDSSPFCEKCGKPLSYTFTDYGAEQELEHHEDHGIDIKKKIDRYSLASIAAGYPIYHHQQLYNLIFGKSNGC